MSRHNSIGNRPDLVLLLALLRDVYAGPHTTLADRANTLATSLATLKRLLGQAESLLGIKIAYSRQSGYRIEDWGVLNKGRVLG